MDASISEVTDMSKSGIILVVLGCLFLASNFELLQWSWLRQWWPVILIALGLWSIFERRPDDSRRSRDTDKST